MAAACAGTALCSSSASALNQIFEMELDRKMKRTRHRPLVRGVVTPRTAAALATTTGLGGATILALGTDPVTASLGVGNIALYAGLYTYMKPRSELNTWVGAVVGAVPPVMGWTAATGGSLMDLEAALLGGTLFLWQFPHFFALSWMHRTDYARGGFQMVPVNDVETNGDRTAALINRYTWYMSTIPVVSSVLGATSSMFAVEGVALNAYALYVAKKFDKDRTNANARKVFLTSLWYLPCLMTLFILHSRRWKEPIDGEDRDAATADTTMENDLVAILRRRVSHVRNAGRELCLHEVLAVADEEKGNNASNADSKCPVALGKSKVTEAAEAGATVASAVASGAAATATVATNAADGVESGK
jgi:protoheme IX farnesyltransferase